LEKKSKVPGILLIAGSAFGILFWLAALFFSFFLGGSPGPGYERSMPLISVAVMCFGFLGAALGLVAGVASLLGANAAARAMVIIAALLGVAGSVSFFLADLGAVGIFVMLIGGAYSGVCFALMRRKRQ
jgi:hypothetical protein